MILARPLATDRTALALPGGRGTGRGALLARGAPATPAPSARIVPEAPVALAVAGARRRRRCALAGLPELRPAVGQGFLGVDDLAKRLFGDVLVLPAAVRGDDNPDGVGLAAIWGSFVEFTSDGAALVLVLNQERGRHSVENTSFIDANNRHD